MSDGTSADDALRARAFERLRARRAFYTHLILYAPSSERWTVSGNEADDAYTFDRMMPPSIW